MRSFVFVDESSFLQAKKNVRMRMVDKAFIFFIKEECDGINGLLSGLLIIRNL